MMGLDLLAGGYSPDANDARDRIYGVVVGVVTNLKDPENLGRVRVRFPWLSETDESNWARVMSPMAGNGRGLFLMPEVDDEVLVMFERGVVERPFVLGALWNGTDKAPAQIEGGNNDLRVLKSKSGHTITLDDKKGAEKITITDKSGKNTITLDPVKNDVAITSEKSLTITAKGNVAIDAGANGDVSITCKKLTIDASAGYSIGSKADGELTAKGKLAISAPVGGVDVNSGALEVK